MLIALVLAQALSLPSPRGPIFSQPSLMGNLPFFSAFAGRGTTAACSATAPTGAKGETLTFTRASTAICTKTASGGLATTLIANGDLVSLSANQPRAEFDSASTLGLLMEGPRTNSCLRSQEFDDAAWSLQNLTCAAVARTANAATAPDGTLTADQIDVAVCVNGASARSTIFTTTTIPLTAASWTFSAYVKGVSGSGTFKVAVTPDGITYYTPNITCSFVSSSWSRCVGTFTAGLTNSYVVIGTDHRDPAQNTDAAAASFYLWGAQMELGGYATSYIPTTSATATRATEAASFPVVLNTASGFSHSHSFTNMGTASFDGAMGLYQDAANRTQLYQYSTNALAADIFSASGSRGANSVPGNFNAGTSYRIAGVYSGAGAASTMTSYLGGVVQNTSATGLTSGWASSVIGFSLNSPWSGTNTIYTRICVDPSPTRCR